MEIVQTSTFPYRCVTVELDSVYLVDSQLCHIHCNSLMIWGTCLVVSELRDYFCLTPIYFNCKEAQTFRGQTLREASIVRKLLNCYKFLQTFQEWKALQFYKSKSCLVSQNLQWWWKTLVVQMLPIESCCCCCCFGIKSLITAGFSGVA